jgi:S1-C subfamily serine protease
MDRFALALLLAVFPILITSQTIAPGRIVPESAVEFRPGVVVEKVAKNSDAERAGLREGDVLLIWNLGGIEDEIKSPLDLYDTERASKRGRASVDHGTQRLGNSGAALSS